MTPIEMEKHIEELEEKLKDSEMNVMEWQRVAKEANDSLEKVDRLLKESEQYIDSAKHNLGW